METNDGNSRVQVAQRGGRGRKEIALDELQRLFYTPLKNVAEHYGICETALKRICRDYGIFRWPYRKLLMINKRISTLQKDLQQMKKSKLQLSKDLFASYEKDIAMLQKEKDAVLNGHASKAKKVFEGDSTKKARVPPSSRPLFHPLHPPVATLEKDQLTPSSLSSQLSFKQSCNQLVLQPLASVPPLESYVSTRPPLPYQVQFNAETINANLRPIPNIYAPPKEGGLVVAPHPLKSQSSRSQILSFVNEDYQRHLESTPMPSKIVHATQRNIRALTDSKLPTAQRLLQLKHRGLAQETRRIAEVADNGSMPAFIAKAELFINTTSNQPKVEKVNVPPLHSMFAKFLSK